MKKFDGLHQYMLENQMIHESDVIEPSMVDMSNLISVHTPRYANGIMRGDLESQEIRRLGLPWTKRLAIRSRLAVQGTINAAIMALQDGVSGNLAGGTHHAMPDHGEGFCVFNDVAVAIKVLQRTMWATKVLVIDCDVHQGNGTAEILKDDPDVFTFSIHAEKNYPFLKPPSSLDIGLDDGTEDDEYLDTLGDALDDIFSQFQPDVVFYLGGIDPLESDHFGRLSLTMNGLYNRDRIVIDRVHKEGIPLVLLLSGGYGTTLRETVEAHALMYKAAMEIYG